MESYKAVVIGAGTAGLSAARVLDNHHVDYLLIDSKKEIGKPIRSTGGVALNFVRKLGMPDSPSVIARYIQSIRLAGDNDDDVVLNFDHPVGVTYDFTKYEQSLARGLNIRMGVQVTGVHGMWDPVFGKQGRATVDTSDGSIQADFVIIATGPNSALAPRDMKINRSDMLVAYEETRVIKNPSKYDLTIWFSKYAEGGYVWDFGDTGNKRRIGLGFPVTNGWNIKSQLEKFTAEHPDIAGDVDHVIAHQIPVGKPPEGVTSQHVAWAGDVVNTCQADTGGGLQTAFWSGREAGMSVVRGDLSWYQHRWNAEIRPHLLRHYKIKRAMYRIGTSNLPTLFPVMRSFNVHSEDASREIPRLLWHVVKNKPSLLLRMIPSLI